MLGRAKRPCRKGERKQSNTIKSNFSFHMNQISNMPRNVIRKVKAKSATQI
jgi:hypothetical protein